MLKIQSTVYPPSRIQNTVKEGGLWYSEKQNEIVCAAKKVINHPIKSDKERFIRKLVIIAIILGLLTLIHIICRS